MAIVGEGIGCLRSLDPYLGLSNGFAPASAIFIC